jgi:hypothetical protein
VEDGGSSPSAKPARVRRVQTPVQPRNMKPDAGMNELRHPGDAKDLPAFMSHAPTAQPVVAIRDVLVVPTTIVVGDYAGDDEQPAGNPPVEIADSLTLEQLTTNDSELVMNACTARGHYFLGVRQFGARYTFVRRVDPSVYAASVPSAGTTAT